MNDLRPAWAEQQNAQKLRNLRETADRSVHPIQPCAHSKHLKCLERPRYAAYCMELSLHRELGAVLRVSPRPPRFKALPKCIYRRERRGRRGNWMAHYSQPWTVKALDCWIGLGGCSARGDFRFTERSA